MQLYRHPGDLRQPERIASWLATTARHECLRVLGSARERPVEPTDAESWSRAGPDPLDDVLVNERRAVVCGAVDQLLVRSLRRLVLLLWEECFYRHVSDATGMAIGSIGPARDRALRRLARRPDVAASPMACLLPQPAATLPPTASSLATRSMPWLRSTRRANQSTYGTSPADRSPSTGAHQPLQAPHRGARDGVERSADVVDRPQRAARVEPMREWEHGGLLVDDERVHSFADRRRGIPVHHRTREARGSRSTSRAPRPSGRARRRRPDRADAP
jgi:hypothetical protein